MYTVTRLIVDAHQSVTHRHQSGVLLPSLTILSPFTGVTITSHHHHSPISLPPFTNVTIIIHPCRYHHLPMLPFINVTTTIHQCHCHNSPVSLPPLTSVTTTTHQCHYHHSPVSLPPFTSVTTTIHQCHHHFHQCHYHFHQCHYHHSPVSLPLSPTSAVWCRQQDWLAKRSLVTSSPFTHNNTTPALAISHQRHY